MIRSALRAAGCLAALAWLTLAAVVPLAEDQPRSRPTKAADEKRLDFDRDVAPILARRCLDCHNKAEHKGAWCSPTRPRHQPVARAGWSLRRANRATACSGNASTTRK